MATSKRKMVYSALIAWGILVNMWVVTPIWHSANHLCPIRPDGAREAAALPAFARKYGISCTQCHTAFPVLNAYGRQFKMQGFVRNPNGEEGVLQSEDKKLWTEKIFPWALIVRSRPFDNGRGAISNQGAQMGATPHPNPNGFKSQPVNDVNFFVAGGDAARKISWFGELDANPPAGGGVGLGDLRFGYHPNQYLNVILARRGFFVDDPYQTISSAESPTIAGRATDLVMADQGSISGGAITTGQQTTYVYGQYFLPQKVDSLTSPSFLYYAAGAAKDDDAGRQSQSPTNGYLRLAYDNANGLMLGTFGAYGHQGPRDASAVTGGTPGVFSKQQFARGGFDALYEIGDLAARGAFAYVHDGDPSVPVSATDRAAYAEVSYNYKRGDNQYPFLMPLIRENWYTTFNGTQQFNYITMQLAHYFAPNLKGFFEYSVDNKRGHQGGTLMNPTTGTLAMKGNRATVQVEVGF